MAFLGVSPVAAQTPAGTLVRNHAEVRFTGPNGAPDSLYSGPADVRVGRAGGLTLAPPRVASAGPGDSVVFAHTLGSTQNLADGILVAATTSAGWTAEVYRDLNANGQHDSGDVPWNGPVTVPAGGTELLLVVARVPDLRALRGTTANVNVTATSASDGGVIANVVDVITVREAGVAIAIAKGVDRASATIGDRLAYAIEYAASGNAAATSAVLVDGIPAGLRYVPGSLTWNGVALTDGAGDDAGRYDSGARVIEVVLGDVSAGAGGQVAFQATVATDAVGLPAVLNQAVARYGTEAGQDTVISAPARTVLSSTSLMLAKDLLSPGPVRYDESVDYRMHYGVAVGAVPALGVALTDTLSDAVELVSALPAPLVNGRVLTWPLGDLAPGTTGEVHLTVRVRYAGLDVLRIRNMATLSALNGGSLTASAPELVVINASAAVLRLDKRAQVLEAGLGDVIPYALVVHNGGRVPLHDLVLEDHLPKGMRYVPGSAVGADSVTSAGEVLYFRLAGLLAPDSGRAVRYQAAIGSAETDVLRNTAVALAEGGRVRSEEVSAFVRLRAGAPMETRAIIGKVWVDIDDDGVQDNDEPGVEGVDVWTVGGEIATSDPEGRFSFRNLQPGRHAFRLDASTLPSAYAVPDGPLASLELRDATGWTTPRVTFRVVPQAARVVSVELPVPWQVIARPVAMAPDSVAAPVLSVAGTEGEPHGGGPVVLRGVEFDFNRATLTPEGSLVLDAVADVLRNHPSIRFIVGGHTDAAGSRRHNLRLSAARARTVREYLVGRGVAASRLRARGFGSLRPVADNASDSGRARNRRVTLEMLAEDGAPGAVQEVRLAIGEIGDHVTVCFTPTRLLTEVSVANPYAFPLAGLAVDFATPADSLRIQSDSGSAAVPVGPRVLLPTLEAQGRLSVSAWSEDLPDSVAVLLHGPGGADRIVAEVHNPLRPVQGRGGIRVKVDSLPAPDALPQDGTAELTLVPPAGRRHAVFELQAGWEPVPGSLRDADGTPLACTTRPSRSGAAVVAWESPERSSGAARLTVRPAGSRSGRIAEAVTVPRLREPEARKAEQRRALTMGAGVEVFAPADGTVSRSDRLFVGVSGEPGMPVTLFDGDSVVADAKIRIDGVYDFVGIKLAAGPHRLRARIVNSWGRERWDSIAVHVSGAPVRFAPGGPKVQLRADGRSETVVLVRVADAWGVPVIGSPAITVAASGGEVVMPDVDPSSVGTQVRPDLDGCLRVTLRSGQEVRQGVLRLTAGSAAGELPLDFLPPLQPLMVTGVGQVGLGASPDDFGAVTARGRLDDRTSLVLSYDSRRLDAGRDAFGRTSDPLEEGQYPILGDESAQRTLTSSRGGFAGRVERGYDWFAVGDLITTGFANETVLARYGRTLTGAAGRVAAGGVALQAFGASTDRRLRQVQLRGAGTAGPYVLGEGIAPGTDIVTLETRDLENPERTLSKESLVRFVDYQVDYRAGTLLFKRPVPASDAYGNPIFVMTAFETAGGRDASAVWGLRAATNPSWLLSRRLGFDSLRVGATWVQDDGVAAGPYTLGGGDLRLRRGPLELGGEMAVGGTPDSNGAATTVDGALRLGGAMRLGARWLHVGEGFQNPAAVALRPRSDDLLVGGQGSFAGNELLLEHAWQRFAADAVDRRRTRARMSRMLRRDLQMSAALSADRFATGSSGSSARSGETEFAWDLRPGMRLFADGRKVMASTGAGALPSHLGAGARLQLDPRIAIEARHRNVFPHDTSGSYGVTVVGLRTRLDPSTEAWSSYQSAGPGGAQGAALVGLGTRRQLGSQWTLNGSFERRAGLGRAGVEDPMRAAPFLQLEEDYWAMGFGAELAPTGRRLRTSLRAERRDGTQRSTRLLSAASAMSVTRDLALLFRQELLRNDLSMPAGPQNSTRLWSLWGVAFRPTRSDRLNLLGKLEWLGVENPRGGGVLANQGAEGRFIASGEGIYEPSLRSELAARYAVRRTRTTLRDQEGNAQELRTHAHFAGGRASAIVWRGLGARLDLRALLERRAGIVRHDLAPQAIYRPVPSLELAAGYRIGSLRDPDFAASGGPGGFLTFGVQVTERTLTSVRDFWFRRLGWAESGGSR